MKIQLIKIGNSQGIRIPKPLIQQCDLQDEVLIDVVDRKIIISSPEIPRADWDHLFREMHENHDDVLLIGDSVSLNSWDDSEWEW